MRARIGRLLHLHRLSKKTRSGARPQRLNSGYMGAKATNRRCWLRWRHGERGVGDCDAHRNQPCCLSFQGDILFKIQQENSVNHRSLGNKQKTAGRNKSLTKKMKGHFAANRFGFSCTRTACPEWRFELEQNKISLAPNLGETHALRPFRHIRPSARPA